MGGRKEDREETIEVETRLYGSAPVPGSTFVGSITGKSTPNFGFTSKHQLFNQTNLGLCVDDSNRLVVRL